MSSLLPPLRVMTIDDSAVTRGTIIRVVEAEPDMVIEASASGAALALMEIERGVKPDVILLDVEMPGRTGIELLPELHARAPSAKIIMVSSLTSEGAEICLKALSLGAVDCLEKPSARGGNEALVRFKRELPEKIRAVCHRAAPVQHLRAETQPAHKPVMVPPVMRSHPPVHVDSFPMLPPAPVRAVAIASSTGGPQALLAFFQALDVSCRHVPFWITQHMPPAFTTLLAERIQDSSGMKCHEPEDGEVVRSGTIYIAPGNFHLRGVEEQGQVFCRLSQEPPVNFCRPSADPMFESLAAVYGRHLLAIVLTGMGQDGLEGARAIARAGGQVVAQDEASSVVWGMPRAVAEAGIAQQVLPLQEFPSFLAKRMAGGLA